MSDTLSDPLGLEGVAGVLPGTTQQADLWASGVAGSTGAALGTGTGRHGLAPLSGLGNGGVGGILTSIKDWLATPFTTPLDPTSIFMLVGVVLVAIVAWNLILFHIRIAAESI